MDSALPPSMALIHAPEERPAALQGRWLLLARSAWVLISFSAVALFIASLAPFYRATHDFTSVHEHGGAALRTGLQQIHFPIALYAATEVVTDSLLVAVFVGVGVLLFWRKSNDPAGLFFSLTLVTFGTIWPNTSDDLVAAHPMLHLPVAAISAFGFGSFFLLCYLFPDGRFVPRWTRFFGLAWMVLEIALSLVPPPAHVNHLVIGAVFAVAIVAFPGTMLYAPIYRYRRESTPDSETADQMGDLQFGGGHLGLRHRGSERLAAGFQPSGCARCPLRSGQRRHLQSGLPDDPHQYRLRRVALPVVGYRPDRQPHAGLRRAHLLHRGHVCGDRGRAGRHLQYGREPLLLAHRHRPDRGPLPAVATLAAARGQSIDVWRTGRPVRSAQPAWAATGGTLAPESILPTIVQSVAEALKLPYAAIALQRGDDLALAAESGTLSRERRMACCECR